MATIGLRSWSLTGNNKTSSTTLAISTLTGTGYPQVGDLIVVGYLWDNTSASAPTCTAMTVTGAGAIGTTTRVTCTDASATAGGDVIVGYAYAVVTTNFTAASVINLTCSAAVTAKAGVVIAFSGGAVLADYTIAVTQAPTAGGSGTTAGVAGANEYAVGMLASQSATAQTFIASSTSWTSLTSGGQAATNVAMRMGVGNPSTTMNIGSIQDGIWILRVSLPVTFNVVATPADTASGTDSVTTTQAVIELPWTYVTAGSNGAATSGTTLSAGNNPGSILPAGTMLVCQVAYDSHASTTAAVVTPSSLPSGDNWTQLFAPVGSGATTTAGTGIWLTAFYCRTTVDIAPFASLGTLTWDNAVTNRIQIWRAYSGGKPGTAILRGPVVTTTKTTGAPSATTGVAPVIGDLVIGMYAVEWANVQADTDSTGGVWTGNGLTQGAADDTGLGANFQYKITTVTGAQTFNPATSLPVDDAVAVFAFAGPDGPFDKTQGDMAGGADSVTSVPIHVNDAAYNAQVIADGAVAYWTMGESGNQLLDSVGTRHATIETVGSGQGGPYARGAPPIAPGLSSSIQSIGTVEGVQASFTNPTTIPAPLSFECWIAPTIGNYGGIQFQSLWLGAMNIQILLADTQLWSTLRINLGDGNNNWLVYTVDLPLATSIHGALNEIAHFVVTVSTTTWVAYQNGIQIGTGPTNGQVNLTGLVSNGWIILGDGSPNQGRHSNHAYYNRVLTPAQVTNHYALGTGVALVVATPADTAGGVDAVASPQGLARTSADTAAGSDALTDNQGYVRTPADTAAGSDTATSNLVLGLPNFDTFTDTFDTLNAATWGSSGTVAAVGGRLAVTETSGGYSGVGSNSRFTLAESSVFVQMTPMALASTARESVFIVSHASASNAMSFLVTGTAPQTMVLRLRTADVNDETNLTYDPVAHAWLRFRMSGTTVYWDTSPDAVTWTNRRSATTVIPFNNSYLNLSAGQWQVESGGLQTAYFDNVNVVAIDRVATPADTAGGTDAVTVTRIVATTAADTAGGTDSFVETQDYRTTAADVAGGVDALVDNQDYLRTPADTAAGTDSTTPVQTIDRQPADIAGGVDSASAVIVVGANVFATPADTAGGTDTAASTKSQARTAADTAAGSDAVTATWDRVTTGGVGATHTIFDTPPGTILKYTDGTPYIRLITGYYRLGPETNGWTVAGVRLYVPVGITVPSTATMVAYLTVGDALAAMTAPDMTSAPTRSGTMSVTPGGWNTFMFSSPIPMNQAYDNVVWIGYEFNDGTYLAVTNTLTSNATKAADGSSVYLASNEGGAWRHYFRIGTGAQNIGDNSTWYGLDAVWAEPGSGLADTATGTDSVSAVTVAGANLLANPADPATGSDSVTDLQDYRPSVADTAGAVDVATSSYNQIENLDDTAAGSDSATVIANRVSPVADVGVGSDSVTVSRTGFAAVEADDIATGLDSTSVTADRTRSISDNASGTDGASTERGLTTNSDLASGVDAVTALFGRVATLDDLANGSDSLNVARAGVITWTVDDPASGSDDVGTSADRGRSSADIAGGGDNLTTTLSRQLGVEDLADGTDTVATATVRMLTALDVAVGSDSISVTTATSQVATVTDVALGTDAVSSMLYLAALTASGVGAYPV